MTVPTTAEHALLALADAQVAGLPSSVGLVVQDRAGRIISANLSAEQILGLTSAQLQGRTSADPRWAVIDPQGDPLPTDRQPAMRVLHTGVPVHGFVMGVHRPSLDASAEHIWLSVTSVPLDTAVDGLPAAVVTSFQELGGPEGELLRLLDSERRYRWIAENATDTVAVLTPDTTHLWVSPSCRELTGYTPDELVGRRLLDLVHPEDLEAARDVLAVLQVEGAQQALTYRLLHAHGHHVWVESTGHLVPAAHGHPGQIIAATRDASRRMAAEHQRDAALRELEVVIDEAPIGTAVVDADGHVLRANQALVRLLGMDPGKLDERSLVDMTHPDDIAASRAELRRLLAGELTTTCSEKRYVRADGRVLWVERTGTLLPQREGRPALFIVQVVDITERKRAQAVLADLAVTDALTGLPNRLDLQDRLTHALAVARRQRSQVGVIFCDLDGFKQVNDTLGHEAGDELLRRVAERLRATVRETDTAVRLGGDEFVVLCEGVSDVRPVQLLAERLQEVLDRPYVLARGQQRVGVSMGVAVGSGQSAAELLQQADEAMYRAKRSGRARPAVHDRDARSADTRPTLQRELGDALRHGDLQLHYQPIVDLVSGQPVSQEALLRWEHAGRGLVLPEEFLPAAEQGPLGLDIGRWVVESACATARGWDVDQRVAVNVSPRQFAAGGFAEHVLTTLERVELPPDRLCLEITEMAVLDATPSTLRSAQLLVDEGVHLGLDDFGTGQSSITALHRLPVHSLKVDGALIADLLRDTRCASLVQGLIQLGAGMGLDVVAEGVETQEQAQWLADHGCPLGQGYYFARPAPASSTGH